MVNGRVATAVRVGIVVTFLLTAGISGLLLSGVSEPVLQQPLLRLLALDAVAFCGYLVLELRIQRRGFKRLLSQIESACTDPDRKLRVAVRGSRNAQSTAIAINALLEYVKLSERSAALERERVQFQALRIAGQVESFTMKCNEPMEERSATINLGDAGTAVCGMEKESFGQSDDISEDDISIVAPVPSLEEMQGSIYRLQNIITSLNRHEDQHQLANEDKTFDGQVISKLQ